MNENIVPEEVVEMMKENTLTKGIKTESEMTLQEKIKSKKKYEEKID